MNSTGRFLLRLRDNPGPTSALIFLVVSMAVAPIAQQYALSLLSAATFSLVLMVWNQSARPSPLTIHGRGIKQADDAIVQTIRTNMPNRSPDKLTVVMIGARLRDLKDLVRDLVNDPVGNVEFKIYHCDLEYLKGAPWPNAESEIVDLASSIRQINEALNPIKSQNIEWSFYSYDTHPSLFAVLIGDLSIFWGHFHWDSVKETYTGPMSNPLFELHRGQSGFSEMLQLCRNRSDQWSGSPTDLSLIS